MMIVKTSGKKNSELYLLSRGKLSSPGIEFTRARSPGIFGKLLASPIATSKMEK